MEKLTNAFLTYIKNNRVGHAFIIFNTSYEKIENELDNIINSYFFKLDKTKNSEIYFIQPEKNVINKEQIRKLQKFLKTYSQFNDKKIYVIKECEKMNLSAANSLLKVLEEPEENIYAFLITNDINKVLPTITSRCINIFLENKESLLNEEKKELFLNIIKLLYNKNSETNIFKIYEKLKSFNKEELIDLTENLVIILKDLLNLKYLIATEFYEKDEISELLKHDNEKEIIRKIEFLNDIRLRLDYNVNINMFIDKIIINW